jgi:hypothetical protein
MEDLQCLSLDYRWYLSLYVKSTHLGRDPVTGRPLSVASRPLVTAAGYFICLLGCRPGHTGQENRVPRAIVNNRGIDEVAGAWGVAAHPSISQWRGRSTDHPEDGILLPEAEWRQADRYLAEGAAIGGEQLDRKLDRYRDRQVTPSSLR